MLSDRPLTVGGTCGGAHAARTLLLAAVLSRASRLVRHGVRHTPAEASAVKHQASFTSANMRTPLHAVDAVISVEPSLVVRLPEMSPVVDWFDSVGRFWM